MPRKVRPAPSSTGWRRAVARFPIRLYRRHLGLLLGHRVCLLTHTGRISGQPRQVVLEVTARDPVSGTVRLASGFGPGAQWYRNIQRHPEVTLQIAGRRTPAVARPMTPEESGRAMPCSASASASAGRTTARTARAGRRPPSACGRSSPHGSPAASLTRPRSCPATARSVRSPRSAAWPPRRCCSGPGAGTDRLRGPDPRYGSVASRRLRRRGPPVRRHADPSEAGRSPEWE
jgi:deazaflavin-dependent oxidoreductase (nitroreductase family)